MLKKHEEILNAIIFDFLRLGISHENIFYSTYDRLDKIIILSDIYQGEIKNKISKIGSTIFDYYQNQIDSGIDEYEINRISIIPLKMESIIKKEYKPITDYFSNIISKYTLETIFENVFSKYTFETIFENIFSEIIHKTITQKEFNNTLTMDSYKKIYPETTFCFEHQSFDELHALSSFFKSKNILEKVKIKSNFESEESVLPTTKIYFQQIGFNNSDQSKGKQPYNNLKDNQYANELTMLVA